MADQERDGTLILKQRAASLEDHHPHIGNLKISPSKTTAGDVNLKDNSGSGGGKRVFNSAKASKGGKIVGKSIKVNSKGMTLVNPHRKSAGISGAATTFLKRTNPSSSSSTSSTPSSTVRTTRTPFLATEQTLFLGNTSSNANSATSPVGGKDSSPFTSSSGLKDSSVLLPSPNSISNSNASNYYSSTNELDEITPRESLVSSPSSSYPSSASHQRKYLGEEGSGRVERILSQTSTFIQDGVRESVTLSRSGEEDDADDEEDQQEDDEAEEAVGGIVEKLVPPPTEGETVQQGVEGEVLHQSQHHPSLLLLLKEKVGESLFTSDEKEIDPRQLLTDTWVTERNFPKVEIMISNLCGGEEKEGRFQSQQQQPRDWNWWWWLLISSAMEAHLSTDPTTTPFPTTSSSATTASPLLSLLSQTYSYYTGKGYTFTPGQHTELVVFWLSRDSEEAWKILEGMDKREWTEHAHAISYHLTFLKAPAGVRRGERVLLAAFQGLEEEGATLFEDAGENDGEGEAEEGSSRPGQLRRLKSLLECALPASPQTGGGKSSSPEDLQLKLAKRHWTSLRLKFELCWRFLIEGRRDTSVNTNPATKASALTLLGSGTSYALVQEDGVTLLRSILDLGVWFEEWEYTYHFMDKLPKNFTNCWQILFPLIQTCRLAAIQGEGEMWRGRGWALYGRILGMGKALEGRVEYIHFMEEFTTFIIQTETSYSSLNSLTRVITDMLSHSSEKWFPVTSKIVGDLVEICWRMRGEGKEVWENSFRKVFEVYVLHKFYKSRRSSSLPFPTTHYFSPDTLIRLLCLCTEAGFLEEFRILNRDILGRRGDDDFVAKVKKGYTYFVATRSLPPPIGNTDEEVRDEGEGEEEDDFLPSSRHLGVGINSIDIERRRQNQKKGGKHGHENLTSTSSNNNGREAVPPPPAPVSLGGERLTRLKLRLLNFLS